MSQFFDSVIKERPHKIELHCHTSGISRCSQISLLEMINTYRQEGYSGLVITNHFYPWQPKTGGQYKKYVEDYVREYHELRQMGEAKGIRVYLGMEINLSENSNDYLLYGIEEDFILNGLSRKLKTLDELVSVYKRPDNLILQAHPFRDGMIMMSDTLLDGFEVYNLHPNHNSRVGFAAKYAAELPSGVYTCGTDFHHTGQGALTALLTRELPSDNRALVECIKNEPVYAVGNSIVSF